MKCGKDATWIYDWNGTPHYACEEHIKAITALAQHMGWPLTSSPIEGEHKCPQEIGEPDV